MSAAQLSSTELSYVTNDKPMLVASNALESAETEKWLTTANLSTGTDRTLANHPISRARDRFNHLQTKPDTTSASTWYLAFDLGASVADFDCLFISGHNFGTIGGLTVSLEIGTDATFGSVTELYTTTPGSSNKRIFSVDLADTGISSVALRHSGERYVRLKMTKGSNFTPAVGELWLGRRRHLPFQFERETDDLRTASEIVSFNSRSGVVTNYVMSRGQQRRSGTVILETDYESTVTSFWSECEQGTKPFLFCAKPNSALSDVQLMNQDPELSFPLVGPNHRELSLNMQELAPFVGLE